MKELSLDFIAEILSGADSGCAYWCSDWHYDKTAYNSLKSEGDCFEDVLAKMLLEGYSITFVDEEGDPDYTKPLTLDRLKAGVSMAESEGYVDDWDDADADTCDAVIQYALFNEIVFG